MKVITKFSIASISLLLSAPVLFGQARIVMNDDAYVVLNDGTAANPIYVTVDNGNANALTVANDGNWVSEGEFNKLRWFIGGNTGTYQIPYTALTGVKIPYEMQVTAAGSGGNFIDFSTYPTDPGNNPLPSMVNHLDAADGSGNNSDNVINRFWINDAEDYTTRPDVELIFGYDDPNDFASITLNPGGLVAQRYRTTDDTWGGSSSGSGLFFGIDNLTQSQVENAVVPGAELWQAWTLTDELNLLPVELTSFVAGCHTDRVDISWTTATELNNEMFVVERSVDGNIWNDIATVDGQGTTNQETSYSVTDDKPRSILSYYRLKQIDYDGTETVYSPQSVQPCDGENGIDVISNNDGKYRVIINTEREGNYDIDLYDQSGRKVRNTKNVNSVSGENVFMFDDSGVATGIYLIRVSNKNEQITKRILIH